MFATQIKWGFLALAMVLQSTVVANHYDHEFPQPLPDFQPRPVPPGPYNVVSTEVGDLLFGSAEMLRATGDQALAVSQSAIQFEQARSLEMDNRRKWIEQRIAQREQWKAGLEQRKATKRARNAARHAARIGLKDLQRDTGETLWPEVLLAAEYEPLRSHVDELVRLQASSRTSSPSNVASLAACVTSLQRMLQRNVHQMDRSEYLAAQRFLRGLKQEDASSIETPELASARQQVSQNQLVN